MKYQIQSYKADDLAAERTVLAEVDGEFTQEALDSWSQGVLAETPPTEGQIATVVPITHAWFITEGDEASHTPGSSDGATTRRPKAQPIAGEKLSFDRVMATSKKASLARRTERIEQGYELAKAKRAILTKK